MIVICFMGRRGGISSGISGLGTIAGAVAQIDRTAMKPGVLLYLRLAGWAFVAMVVMVVMIVLAGATLSLHGGMWIGFLIAALLAFGLSILFLFCAAVVDL